MGWGWAGLGWAAAESSPGSTQNFGSKFWVAGWLKPELVVNRLGNPKHQHISKNLDVLQLELMAKAKAGQPGSGTSTFWLERAF